MEWTRGVAQHERRLDVASPTVAEWTGRRRTDQENLLNVMVRTIHDALVDAYRRQRLNVREDSTLLRVHGAMYAPLSAGLSETRRCFRNCSRTWPSQHICSTTGTRLIASQEASWEDTRGTRCGSAFYRCFDCRDQTHYFIREFPGRFCVFSGSIPVAAFSRRQMAFQRFNRRLGAGWGSRLEFIVKVVGDTAGGIASGVFRSLRPLSRELRGVPRGC